MSETDSVELLTSDDAVADDATEPSAPATYHDLFYGRLIGIQNSEQYLKLADSLEGVWWAISFDDPKSGAADFKGETAKMFMRSRLEEVQRLHLMGTDFPYTYVAYVDDQPALIKLYHPLRGNACGGSEEAPNPWWTFSSMKPEVAEVAALRK
jgi:hypothetical protein